MLRAQYIYWTQYNVDIEECLTLSSLAMNIYRMRYYNEEGWPIYIPSSNQDSFIRRGYYGGHAETYKPYGGAGGNSTVHERRREKERFYNNKAARTSQVGQQVGIASSSI